MHTWPPGCMDTTRLFSRIKQLSDSRTLHHTVASLTVAAFPCPIPVSLRVPQHLPCHSRAKEAHECVWGVCCYDQRSGPGWCLLKVAEGSSTVKSLIKATPDWAATLSMSIVVTQSPWSQLHYHALISKPRPPMRSPLRPNFHSLMVAVIEGFHFIALVCFLLCELIV